MLTVTAGSASELFTGACRAVLASGKPAAPRALPTVEVIGATLILTDPRRRLVDVPPASRRPSHALAGHAASQWSPEHPARWHRFSASTSV